MEEQDLKAKIMAVSKDGKISCAKAQAIADELNISRKQVGDMLNELKVKIISCQLGCFP